MTLLDQTQACFALAGGQIRLTRHVGSKILTGYCARRSDPGRRRAWIGASSNRQR